MGRRDVLDVMACLRERTTIFYSTHILDDVQRVSDMVAILNRGELVTQAPVEQLLKEGNLTFTLTLQGSPGDNNEALARVRQQPWVDAVDVQPNYKGAVIWRVSVRDESAAEAHLLPLVIWDGTLRVMDFGRTRENLEQVFMQLVEESRHHVDKQ